MSRLLVKIQSLKERLMLAALWTGLLAAAWSLPVIDRIAANAEREKMESGYYYQPKLPAAAYAEAEAEAEQ